MDRNLRERDHLEDAGLCEAITLKWILRKFDLSCELESSGKDSWRTLMKMNIQVLLKAKNLLRK